MNFYHESKIGKLAVGLTMLYLIILLLFFLLMSMGIVDFDTGHYWDITLGVLVVVELAAFVLSIIAIRKEKTILVKFSLVIGILSLAFLLTHSFFIND
ncbi:hypothetical protein E9840_04385 [Tissierella creatinini]|nr:hypothetical protein E9840_04385 [Tissierella creatinini]TJX63109.1 hypothetical protein E8P77_15785 [Soehngenia saccharolytica]